MKTASRPYELSAGDGEQEGNDIAVFEGGLIAIEMSDIFVINVNIYDTLESAVFGEDLLPEKVIPADELLEEFVDCIGINLY